jgi:hypothetical protein
MGPTIALDWTTTPEAKVLITLFVDHTADEMKTTNGQRLIANAFQFPIAEYTPRAQRQAFREPFVKLLELRMRVDSIKATRDVEAQCRRAGALLKKYRKQNAAAEMWIARNFIERSFYPEWDKTLRERLTDISNFFEQYKDYFLSYTNKHAHRTNTDFSKTFYPETKSGLSHMA